MSNTLVVSEVVEASRISFILGIKSGFNTYNSENHNNNPTNYVTDVMVYLIQDFMNNHRELEDVSMTVTEVKGLYREEYGCPDGGEKLYKITSMYNPFHGQSKQDWYDTIMKYATALSEYFQQTACTVIIENFGEGHPPLECIYIKNEFDNRRML